MDGPFGEHIHPAFLAIHHHEAIREGKQGIVLGTLNVQARMELGATLANDDAAGRDKFPGVGFDSAMLGVRIASVARRTLPLFMCHVPYSL